MRLTTTIIRPLLTEKTTNLVPSGKFTFMVHLKASKGAIAEQIEKTFSVDVIDVRTQIMPGKHKRMLGDKKKQTKLQKWKKAIVTLKKGQKISMFEVKE